MVYRKVVTFWRMPLQHKGLFVSSFFLCGIARLATLLIHYKKMAFYYGHFYQMTVMSTLVTPQQQQQAIFIKKMIQLASAYTPWNSNCLTQALVAKFWCQFYQIPYMLFIGLAKQSDKPRGEEGHAWLTAGRVAITGGYCFFSHVVVSSYSNLSQDK